jgi:cellulase/cellobiase CelA1
VNAGRQRQRVLELLDEALDALNKLVGSPSLGDEHSWNRYFAELAYARVEEARALVARGGGK